jgi:hypothetical protein
MILIIVIIHGLIFISYTKPTIIHGLIFMIHIRSYNDISMATPTLPQSEF